MSVAQPINAFEDEPSVQWNPATKACFSVKSRTRMSKVQKSRINVATLPLQRFKILRRKTRYFKLARLKPYRF